MSNIIIHLSGGYSEGDTPVSIPNTEVKPFCADDTSGATPWESKSLPGYLPQGRHSVCPLTVLKDGYLDAVEMPLTLEIYRDQNGNEPFEKWLSKIKDETTERRIRQRLSRIENTGNLGHYRRLGGGISEIKVDIGPGYRIYFGKIGKDIILLLRGGDKDSQDQDIPRAKEDWEEHKSRSKKSKSKKSKKKR